MIFFLKKKRGHSRGNFGSATRPTAPDDTNPSDATEWICMWRWDQWTAYL